MADLFELGCIGLRRRVDDDGLSQPWATHSHGLDCGYCDRNSRTKKIPAGNGGDTGGVVIILELGRGVDALGYGCRSRVPRWRSLSLVSSHGWPGVVGNAGALPGGDKQALHGSGAIAAGFALSHRPHRVVKEK